MLLEQGGVALPHRLLGRPAEQALGALVPEADAAVQAMQHDGIAGLIQHLRLLAHLPLISQAAAAFVG